MAGPDVHATAVAAGHHLCRRRQRTLTSICETFLLEWRTERLGTTKTKQRTTKKKLLPVDVHLKWTSQVLDLGLRQKVLRAEDLVVSIGLALGAVSWMRTGLRMIFSVEPPACPAEPLLYDDL